MKYLQLFLIISIVFISSNFPQQFNQLADAVIKKDTVKIQQLLQSGVDINIQHPTSGTTVLMISSSYYYYDDMVEYLIGKGADVNLKDSEGKTALLWASSNSLENAKILIANSAKVNEAANDGMTPFLQATLGVSSGKVPIEMCDLLRKNGANINAELKRQSALRWTALHYASANGDAELVKYLIKHGANVNKATGEGSTPLFLAKLGEYDEVIKILKNAGAKE
ncbi:MAG TPA: ankyrin repeat domain-containing protein [Ignavibacteriaceae bacterium]|nr:ankyrin repeat domain-containing protein [Ignavibacteriaceae bacterium]